MKTGSRLSRVSSGKDEIELYAGLQDSPNVKNMIAMKKIKLDQISQISSAIQDNRAFMNLKDIESPEKPNHSINCTDWAAKKQEKVQRIKEELRQKR